MYVTKLLQNFKAISFFFGYVAGKNVGNIDVSTFLQAFLAFLGAVHKTNDTFEILWQNWTTGAYFWTKIWFLKFKLFDVTLCQMWQRMPL